MKKNYLNPSIEIELFDKVDVLESSDGAGFDAGDLLGQEEGM
jgi:hypothetical protein